MNEIYDLIKYNFAPLNTHQITFYLQRFSVRYFDRKVECIENTLPCDSITKS